MEEKDQMVSISLTKVLEMIRTEERQAIKEDLTNRFGKTTGDCIDSYQPKESKIIQLFFTK